MQDVFAKTACGGAGGLPLPSFQNLFWYNLLHQKFGVQSATSKLTGGTKNGTRSKVYESRHRSYVQTF